MVGLNLDSINDIRIHCNSNDIVSVLDQRLAIKNSVVSLVKLAIILNIADLGIKDLILSHIDVSAQVNRIVSTPQCFLLRKLEKYFAYSSALTLRVNCDCVNVESLFCFDCTRTPTIF